VLLQRDFFLLHIPSLVAEVMALEATINIHDKSTITIAHEFIVVVAHEVMVDEAVAKDVIVVHQSSMAEDVALEATINVNDKSIVLMADEAHVTVMGEDKAIVGRRSEDKGTRGKDP